MDLQEVTLFPTRPTDFPDSPGLGFPIRFRVETANDETFSNPDRIFDTGDVDFINPGDNPVSIPARGNRGRYVRVTPTRLFIRDVGNKRYALAMAEMQVWSGNANVALGRPVQVSDEFGDPRYPRWQPQFLVDGYNSQFRLLDLREWLTGLATRGELERKRIEREQAHTSAVNATLASLGKATVGGVAGLILIGAALFWRGRRARRRELDDLRRRIASDLHDEIGSNLGTIALVAERAQRSPGDPALSSENFDEVRRIATSTAESMRDLVWMLKGDGATLSELILRMREATSPLPEGVTCQFEVRGTIDERHLPLGFVRHLYLSFREMLHNAFKHARPTRVTIGVEIGKRDLALRLDDDGVGFDPATVSSNGDGLFNLRNRARSLGGSLQIDSKVGAGTRIELRAPFPSP